MEEQMIWGVLNGLGEHTVLWDKVYWVHKTDNGS
jgi:hypothetical protein